MAIELTIRIRSEYPVPDDDFEWLEAELILLLEDYGVTMVQIVDIDEV